MADAAPAERGGFRGGFGGRGGRGRGRGEFRFHENSPDKNVLNLKIGLRVVLTALCRSKA